MVAVCTVQFASEVEKAAGRGRALLPPALACVAIRLLASVLGLRIDK
jgi:hypothetical protein